MGFKKSVIMRVVLILIALSVICSLLNIPNATKIRDKELVLAMSQFEVSLNKDGKQVYNAKDAKIMVVHPDRNWTADVIINNDSNVAHKAAIGDVDRDGKNELYVAGGQSATFKVYKYADGNWSSEMIWKPDFIRVRDIWIGDVNNDGKKELVVGTHDRGVVQVFEYKDGKYVGTEVYMKNSTYIHDVRIGDVDGDGVNEFFATATDPNVAQSMAQLGSIVMFKWNGKGYDSATVEKFNHTHSKEIEIGDIDNDGRNELVASLQGIVKETNASAQDLTTGAAETEVVLPAEIRVYNFEDGGFSSEVIAKIHGEFKARSMKIGDIDNDGSNELVVGTATKGLQVVHKTSDAWNKYVLDSTLTGDIHSMFIADFDNDGKNELVANSDGMGIIKMYKWVNGAWDKKLVLNTPAGDWVWNMDYGDADNA